MSKTWLVRDRPNCWVLGKWFSPQPNIDDVNLDNLGQASQEERRNVASPPLLADLSLLTVTVERAELLQRAPCPCDHSQPGPTVLACGRGKMRTCPCPRPSRGVRGGERRGQQQLTTPLPSDNQHDMFRIMLDPRSECPAPEPGPWCEEQSRQQWPCQTSHPGAGLADTHNTIQPPADIRHQTSRTALVALDTDWGRGKLRERREWSPSLLAFIVYVGILQSKINVRSF